MAKRKRKSKSKTKKPQFFKNYINYLSTHKLIVFLSILLLIAIYGTLIQPKYQDWDNAQMIKGLAKDFPALVEEIEAETGLDLEIKSNCSTTTEKFSAGVKTCEMSVGYIGLDDSIDVVSGVVFTSEKFVKNYEFEYGTGSFVTYRGKNSCTLNFVRDDRFNFSCITAVREANTDLAIEVFKGIK